MLRPVSAVVVLLALAGAAYADTNFRRIGRSSSYQPWRSSSTAPSPDLANLYSFRSTGAGTDRMATADHASLECGTVCTFGFRVRTDAGNISADRFFTKADNASQQSMRIDTSAASPYSVRLTLCAVADCSTQYTVTTRTGATPSVLNLFTTIVASIDWVNDIAVLYVDGAHQVISLGGSFPAAWVDTTSEWTIGANSGALDAREMSGWFDDVFIDPDHAWTAEEVYAWHNKRGSRTMPSGVTVASWCRGGDDNAGAGSTCTDASGNGRNWTLSGSGVFASTVPTKIAEEVADTTGRTRQVLIGIGQSNIGGRGTIGDLGGSQDDEFPDRARCYVYDNNGPVGTPNGVTVPCAEPWDINTGQAAVFPASDDASTGVGPMVAAAQQLLEHWPNRQVGLIPCALGNSNSYVFSVSHAFTVSSNVFAECESRWDPAAIGANAEIAGIVVYQGENDADLATGDADEWDYRWQAIVEGIRDDIGERDVPVVVVVLPVSAGSGSGPQHAVVRASQLQICGKLDHCTVVQAPTGYMVDGIHQTTAAQLALGELIGDALYLSDYGQLLDADNTAPALSGVVSFTAGASSLVLDWPDATGDVVRYAVTANVASGTPPTNCVDGTVLTGCSSPSSSTCTATGLTPMVQYSFAVCAVDALGNTTAVITGTGMPVVPNVYSFQTDTSRLQAGSAADSTLWECTDRVTFWGCHNLVDVVNDTGLIAKYSGGAPEKGVLTIGVTPSSTYQLSGFIGAISNYCRVSGLNENQWYCWVATYNGAGADNEADWDWFITTPGTGFSAASSCTSVSGSMGATIPNGSAPLNLLQLGSGSSCGSVAGCGFGPGYADSIGHACYGKATLAEAQCIMPNGRPRGGPVEDCLTSVRSHWSAEEGIQTQTFVLPASPTNSASYSISVNGTTITGTTDASATRAELQAAMVAAVNASAQASVVTAANATNDVIITSDSAGLAFTYALGSQPAAPMTIGVGTALINRATNNPGTPTMNVTATFSTTVP